jgi:hypothetical protein
MPIHISSPDGEAKFWLEPSVELADCTGFKKKDLGNLQKTVEEQANEFKLTWKK